MYIGLKWTSKGSVVMQSIPVEVKKLSVVWQDVLYIYFYDKPYKSTGHKVLRVVLISDGFIPCD